MYMQHMSNFKGVVSCSLHAPRTLQNHVQLSGSYHTAIDQIHRTQRDEMVIALAWAASCTIETAVDVLFKVIAPMIESSSEQLPNPA